MEPPLAAAAGEAAAGARTEAAGAARPINASAPDRNTFRIATSRSSAHPSSPDSQHGTSDGRCNRAAHECGRTARADAPPYRVGNGGGSGISRETENLFGHDVALDLGRAAADGQRRGEQEAAGPGRVARRIGGPDRAPAAHRARPGQHAVRARPGPGPGP